MEFFSVKIRQTGSFRAFLEPGHVAFGPKKPYFTLLVLVGFEAFVTGDSIMQSGVKGMEVEGSKRLHDWGLPFLVIVKNVDHVITGKCTKG